MAKSKKLKVRKKESNDDWWDSTWGKTRPSLSQQKDQLEDEMREREGWAKRYRP